MTAFFEAYNEVRLALPNRPVLVCRPLTIRWAARFLDALESDAHHVVFGEFIDAIATTKAVRKELKKLRDHEVLAVIERFLDPTRAKASSSGKAKGSTMTLDDKLAEYAAVYGGPPDADMAWPLFLALTDRVQRFYARRELAMLDGVFRGAAPLLDGKAGMALRQRMQALVQAAYPWEPATPVEFPVNQGRN